MGSRFLTVPTVNDLKGNNEPGCGMALAIGLGGGGASCSSSSSTSLARVDSGPSVVNQVKNIFHKATF